MTSRFAALVLVALIAGPSMPSTTAVAAEIAASISYEFVARPAFVPDVAAPANVERRYVAIKAIDGFRVDAALFEPRGKSAAETPMIVIVHGSGSNFHSSPNGTTASGLAERGYATLAINTRQHDGDVNTDNFLDVRRDIEAAVQVARALGHKSIVLQGHSLGNIQVQFHAATNWDKDIKAVILLGAFANLPWKSRNILVQNEENFAALTDAAMKAVAAGAPETLLPVKMRWFTGEEVPVTAQHFLTYRLSETSVADGTYWIRRIPRPILMVRDQADGVVLPFEPAMLLSAAHAEHSLARDIKYVPLANANPPSLKGHSFVDNGPALIETIAGWLAAHDLR